ncbi:MAG: AtpZ/AtpI family protein [Sphingomicrobium sp.]
MINGSDEFQDAPSAQDPDLQSLDRRIAEARATEEARNKGPLAGVTAASGAKSIAGTMIGYPLGGIIIGYGLDRLLGTTPWITIGLMFAAFFAACFQVATKVRS